MLFKRTHMCGELRLADEGKTVVLNGWVAKARSLGSLVFVDLRDKTGITQVTFNEDVPADVLELAKSLRSEFCIGVKGEVKERSSKNSNIPTGDIEVFATDLVIYSKSDTPPIYVKDDDKKYLWKIHGELSNIGSIMLGYYHYCSYIGQIKKYLMGEYEFAKRKEMGIIPQIEDRLPITPNNILSWIDLFFMSNLYIIGLGLNYEEMDLWWILTIRKRLVQKLGKNIINNNIVYYGELELGRKSMFEHLDVEVVSSKKRTYENKYQEYINDIKKRTK